MKTRQITKSGKNADVEMKIPGVSVLWLLFFLIQKLEKSRIKFQISAIWKKRVKRVWH